MLGFIERKIEEIRQKPENIRIRYVWGSVAVVMLVVISVWVVNLRESFRKSDMTSETETMREALSERSAPVLEESEPSLEAVFGDEAGLGESR